MKIARVFPRKTKATPRDDLCFFEPPGLFPPDVDEVHVSVAFTWDIPKAEWLAYQWEKIAPVKLGGPAYNQESGEFEPGRYLKPGYVITSRGCPNHCWFCSVWKREPKLKELEIKDGWNVLDDNLLACSESHIRSVFAMLKRQKEQPMFTGGLEAAKLKDWHIDLLVEAKPKRLFFAYDTPDDLEPLQIAVCKIFMANVLSQRSHGVRCYVLMGYPGDTIESAKKRLIDVVKTGAFPMAMVYRNKKGKRDPEWISFAWKWSRPPVIQSLIKDQACWVPEQLRRTDGLDLSATASRGSKRIPEI